MHIFFIQFDPDIDYIVPIAYKLASNDKNITIICLNPLHDIYSDYRLQYLKNILGVNILYLHQISNTLRLLSKLLLGLFSIFSNSQIEKFYAFYSKQVLIGKLLEIFLIKNNTVSVTIDEAAPPHILKIINCAKNVGIISVMLPTGAVMFNKRFCEIDFSTDYKIISPQRDVSNHSIVPSRIIFMGVTRYCAEWQEMNSKLINNLSKSYILPLDEGKLRVVVFGNPTLDFTKDKPLIKKIANDSGVSLIFKDKPRGVKDNAGSFDSYPSALLIQWADVVVGSISSIILDVFYYKKQFIYARYLFNDSLARLDNYDVCMVANDEGMVLNYLSDLKLNQKPHHSNNGRRIKEYYESTVYASDRNFDVLGDYYKFYDSLKLHEQDKGI